jgi:hypothetical protein
VQQWINIHRQRTGSQLPVVHREPYLAVDAGKLGTDKVDVKLVVQLKGDGKSWRQIAEAHPP